MNTFQMIFQNGRVQNILADRWRNESGTVLFEVEGKPSASFQAHELIMVDQLDDDGYTPQRHRPKIKARTP